MTLDTFLGHFNAVRRIGKRWTAQCPAHDDTSRNTLHIGLGTDRRRLLICRAGTCDINAILGAARLRAKDLFDDDGGGRARGLGPVIQKARDPWSLASVLLETLRRARQRRDEAWVLYPLADAVRHGSRRVESLRAWVTALGPEFEQVWDLAATAAAIEREVFGREADLDATAHQLRHA